MDSQAICKVLDGKVRGRPVAISRFLDQPPTGFDGLKVDPCQILRHAMDVIVTTGDMGGRMNNKLRTAELFVIIPAKWAENLVAIMKAPKFVRKMAVGNVEDYAEEQGETRISLAVVTAQAESVGMVKFMRDLDEKPGTGWLRRIFRKR